MPKCITEMCAQTAQLDAGPSSLGCECPGHYPITWEGTFQTCDACGNPTQTFHCLLKEWVAGVIGAMLIDDSHSERQFDNQGRKLDVFQQATAKDHRSLHDARDRLDDKMPDANDRFDQDIPRLTDRHVQCDSRFEPR